MALGRIRNNDFSGDEEEDDDDQDTTDEAPSMNNNLQKLAHIYRSENDVKLRFQKHEPLSIVVKNEHIFGCLIRFGMLQELVCVQFHKEKVGAYYYAWKLGSVSIPLISALKGTLQGVSRRSPGRSRPRELGRSGLTRQPYERTRQPEG